MAVKERASRISQGSTIIISKNNVEYNPAELVHKLGAYLVSDNTLGHGSFAKVRLALHVKSGFVYAMKIIRKPEDLEEQNAGYKRIRREVDNMRILNHQNIIELVEVFQTKRFICIVMEYCSVGDLFEYVAKKKRLEEKEALRLFDQILSAVNYCHQKRVVHRDLKPENIFLDKNLNVRLGDFGFSRSFDPSQPRLSTCCGSFGFAAPELLLGEKYVGPSADIWSLGVILYMMICGVNPFNLEKVGEDKNAELNMLLGKYEDSPYLSEFTRNLLDRIFDPKPENRITGEELEQLLHTHKSV